MKFPSEYASLLNLTERHLNRICKTCVNKTPTDLILERVILEAKRMLIHSTNTVAETADELGYLDNSYFSRLFRNKTGQTPKEFISTYDL
jgi:AraC family transcriptional regulator, transcriptional activator of pobA